MSRIFIPSYNVTPELDAVLDAYTPVRLGHPMSCNAILVERARFDTPDCKYVYSVCTDVSSCTGHYVIVNHRGTEEDSVRTRTLVPLREVDGDLIAVLCDPKLLCKKVICAFSKQDKRFAFAVGHARPWKTNSVTVLDEEHAVFEA